MRMTYEEFREAVTKEFQTETLYKDSEGRDILVMGLVDAYYMAFRLAPRLIDSKIEGAKNAIHQVTPPL